MLDESNAGYALRRTRPGEWRELRDTRLRALADTPDAFRVVLAEDAARPDSDWREWAAGDAAYATFAAIGVDGRWVGMAGVFIGDDATIADVVAMWVDPARRGRGIGRGLLRAVDEWARSQGAKRLRLSVTETNVEARTLYASAGFVETGHTEPLREGSSLTVFELIREAHDG